MYKILHTTVYQFYCTCSCRYQKAKWNAENLALYSCLEGCHFFWKQASIFLPFLFLIGKMI